MWRRIFVAMGVVALLSLTSFVVLQDTISQAETTSDALLPLAHERTLLEHIHLTAIGMARPTSAVERDSLRAQLLSLADDLEATEAAFGAPEANSSVARRMPDPVRALYHGPPANLHARLGTFVADAREFAAVPDSDISFDDPLLHRMESNLPALFTDLEGVVVAYQTEQVRIDERLRSVAFLVFAATLTVLTLAIFVAFQPPMNRIRLEVERLDELRAQLQRRVEERTAALERRADELARSNRDLEQFAYVASHDLQEPLRVIGGALQYVREHEEKKLDQDTRQLIGYAVDSSRRMQVLIQDLLAYSRLDRPPVRDTPVSAEAAYADAVKNLHAAIKESKAQVTRDALPRLAVDHNLLVQIFQNLIGNGLKFRGTKAPRVHVGVDREGPMWHFTVKDNGIGIEPQHKERVFVIFQRLDRAGKYGGSGIGLAICKKIIERHGGKIWFESDGPGKGTTFHFTLPYREWPTEASGRPLPQKDDDVLHERLKKVV